MNNVTQYKVKTPMDFGDEQMWTANLKEHANDEQRNVHAVQFRIEDGDAKGHNNQSVQKGKVGENVDELLNVMYRNAMPLRRTLPGYDEKGGIGQLHKFHYIGAPLAPDNREQNLKLAALFLPGGKFGGRAKYSPPCQTVTFQEFLQYIVYVASGEGTAHALDDHFRPVHYGCNPCKYEPDFVGHMETMRNDRSVGLINK
jgi:hypothetical protein